MPDEPKKQRGGYRPGAGRKKGPPKEAVAGFAAKLIASLSHFDPPKNEPGEIGNWRDLWWSAEQRVKLDTRKYWYDKRDGKAIHTVNHLHDKPIDVNVNVSIAEIVRKVRERKEQYERSR